LWRRRTSERWRKKKKRGKRIEEEDKGRYGFAVVEIDGYRSARRRSIGSVR